MKSRNLIILLLCFFISSHSYSQHKSSEKNVGHLGLGIGLPYGGIGLQLGYNIAKGTKLFAGLGYNFNGLGINGGLSYSFPSNKQTQFYLTALYGSNAVTIVQGAPEYNKTYYGPSFGPGLKINSLSKEGNYWDVGLLIPVRSEDYQNTLDAIKSDPRITEVSEPWPILIVVGYNFNLSK